jgi:hypothetical protein
MGGTIVYHASDINCHAIDNWGSATIYRDLPAQPGAHGSGRPDLVVRRCIRASRRFGPFNVARTPRSPGNQHIIHIKFASRP